MTHTTPKTVFSGGIFDVFKDQIYVRLGNNVTLPCSTEKQQDRVRWKHNGEAITTPRVRTEVDGNITISSIQHNDNGIYTCTLGNHEYNSYNINIYSHPEISLKVSAILDVNGCNFSTHAFATDSLRTHICQRNRSFCKAVDQFKVDCQNNQTRILTIIEMPNNYLAPNCKIACMQNHAKNILLSEYVIFMSLLENNETTKMNSSELPKTEFVVRNVCLPSADEGIAISDEHHVCIRNSKGQSSKNVSTNDDNQVALLIACVSFLLLVAISLDIFVVYVCYNTYNLMHRIEDS